MVLLGIELAERRTDAWWAAGSTLHRTSQQQEVEVRTMLTTIKVCDTAVRPSLLWLLVGW